MPTLDEQVAALNPGDEIEVHFKDDYNGYDYTVTGVTTCDNEKYGNYLLVGPVFVREGNGKPSYGVSSVTVVKKATVPEPTKYNTVVIVQGVAWQKKYGGWYEASSCDRADDWEFLLDHARPEKNEPLVVWTPSE